MANLVELFQSLFSGRYDQTVPTGNYSPPHQETHIYQNLDQDQKVVVQPVQNWPANETSVYLTSSLASFDALEDVEDYRKFLESQTRNDPHVVNGESAVTGEGVDARQCTEEHRSVNNTAGDFNEEDDSNNTNKDLDKILETMETAEVASTAAEIFAKIQYGSEDSSLDDSMSEGSGSVPSPPSSDDCELLTLEIKREVDSESELNGLFAAAQSGDFFTEQEAENTAMYELEPDTGLPKLSELLGEQNVKEEYQNMQNDNNNFARTGIPQQRPTWNHIQSRNMQPSPMDSEASYDDSDEDYQPVRAAVTANQRVDNVSVHMGPSPPPNARRSRRRSRKLWDFLLDALCDPKLNPSVIRWENKKRGLFKIEDTKLLSEMWGRRAGKTQKQGSQHSMNYEKFSRAMRYYYKRCVLTSVPGRLTYQFGPNATGWRARAEGVSVEV